MRRCWKDMMVVVLMGEALEFVVRLVGAVLVMVVKLVEGALVVVIKLVRVVVVELEGASLDFFTVR